MSTSPPELRLVTTEPEPPDNNLGKTLDGRYHLERLLGKGGMGLVYEAKHVILGKRLAVKVLKEEVSRDEKVIARFQREAQSAGAIGSPHICDVSDFGTMPDGSTYFVMEYLDGPSLSTALHQQNPMPTARVLDVGIQLCDALGAAHERGIVHRDLKPDNVHLVEQGGRRDFVKVLDFGIAKVGNAADKKLTQAGQVFGTPHYMSPEQCAGRDVDHRTDIYALGVMLYEMACGVVPFDADSLMGVLTKHVYENPIPPRELPPPVDVPPGLEAIILKSLAKQPEHRYQSMAELRADLEILQYGGTPHAVLQAFDASGRPVGVAGGDSSGLMAAYPAMPSQPAAALAAEPARGSALLFAGGAFLLLLLGAGVFAAAFFLSGSEGDATTSAAGPAAGGATTASATGATTSGTGGTTSAGTGAGETTAGTTGEPGAIAPTGEGAGAPAQVRVRLDSEPAGCEVYGPDGSLMGNTPIEIPRPAAGEPPVTLSLRFANHEDRDVPISHLTAEQLTVRLERRRVARPGSVRPVAPPPVVTSPHVRPLAPTPIAPRPSRPSNSEIVNPW
ncbi:MAG: serine/threonine protein kinase [Sandaracinaceae bacterium]|nr:serine/threonine protein kinase [Sandaracinaceae bacterium]